MRSILLLILLSTCVTYSSQTLTAEYRNDAGAPNTQSGFFQANAPVNFPPGAFGWWHLLDLRHISSVNNHAMQLSGSYSEPGLWFRKISNLSVQSSDTSPWSKVVLENPSGNVGIGVDNPQAKLEVRGNMKINSPYEYTFLTLGNEANDQLIVDNTILKSYGGGYFFRVHNETAVYKYLDAMVLTEYGDIGIGTNHPQAKLEVAGKSSFTDNMKVTARIEAKEIKVTQTPTADFVFEDTYNLPKLEDVEKHIKANNHLPEIASAKEMEKEGVNIGEFQIKLLQKIEELTLYSIEQNKQIKQLLEMNKILKDEFDLLKLQQQQKQQQQQFNSIKN